MRFYSGQHEFYVGIDLHARQMYVCVMDQAGEILLHRNMPTDAEHLGRTLSRFGDDKVVAVECVFNWYWIADYCEDHNIPFVLGHAYYMKTIHGGKVKNDRLDSKKIAMLLRGGMLPHGYVYPREMRAARDLLRRREYFMHHQSELLTHIQNTNTQYNYPAFEKSLGPAANRVDVAERFTDPNVRKSVETDVYLLEVYHRVLLDLEAQIKREVKHHDPVALAMLRTIPRVGPILALVILYEIGNIHRFPTVGQFISYSRLVKCSHESAGKRVKGKNNKIGNGHLKWAFSEAAVLFLRGNKRAQQAHQKRVNKYGKAKALSILAQNLGRTVYYMLKRKEPFDARRFFGDGVAEPAA